MPHAMNSAGLILLGWINDHMHKTTLLLFKKKKKLYYHSSNLVALHPLSYS